MKSTTLHAGLLALLLATAASAEPVGLPLQRPAPTVAHAERAYLLGIAQAGERLVAVGERGIIVLSDDQGTTWRQVPTPVSVTLSTVRFADEHNGYAVGHGGSVLTTQDGGEHWTLSLEGQHAAQILLQAAQAQGDERAIADAQRLLADGPDKPFLDIWVGDARHALAVGAYGLALATQDGGKSWQPALSREDNPGALHLNAVRAEGQRVLIVGEQGLVLFSDDGGAHFRPLETPYKGSFFTAELLPGNGLLIAGLRGTTLRSEDHGATWTQLVAPVEASITASALTPAGELLLASQAGLILQVKGDRLVPQARAPLPPLNNVLATRQGHLLVLSEQGVAVLPAGEQK
jgi:photosystem II stability/assembly factor-like uncharacterized protein